MGRKVAVAVGDEVKSPEVLVSVSLIGPVGQPVGCGNNLGVNIDVYQVCLSIFVSGSSHGPNQAKETETPTINPGTKVLKKKLARVQQMSLAKWLRGGGGGGGCRGGGEGGQEEGGGRASVRGEEGEGGRAVGEDDDEWSPEPQNVGNVVQEIGRQVECEIQLRKERRNSCVNCECASCVSCECASCVSCVSCVSCLSCERLRCDDVTTDDVTVWKEEE